MASMLNLTSDIENEERALEEHQRAPEAAVGAHLRPRGLDGLVRAP